MSQLREHTWNTSQVILDKQNTKPKLCKLVSQISLHNMVFARVGIPVQEFHDLRENVKSGKISN